MSIEVNTRKALETSYCSHDSDIDEVLYLVEQVGRASRTFVGIFNLEEYAKQAAYKASKLDVDDYHTYEVFPVIEGECVKFNKQESSRLPYKLLSTSSFRKPNDEEILRIEMNNLKASALSKLTESEKEALCQLGVE